MAVRPAKLGGAADWQQVARLLLGDAGIDLRPVVAGRLAEDARAVVDPAALGIGGAVVEPPQAGEGDRLGAHRTGLEGHVEIALDQARRAQPGGRGANRQQLGMGGRIAVAFGAVAGLGQHLAVGTDDHRADRHLAPLCG